MSKPVDGILFPADPKASAKGNPTRSSTFGNKSAWTAAAAVVDEAEAQKIGNEKNWRQNYQHYVIRHVELSLQSPENALNMAKAGLDYCYKNFEFARDGKITSLDDAMQTYVTPIFKTGFIKGSCAKTPTPELSVPYKQTTLKNEKLLDQLTQWVIKGTIEPSAKAAIELVVKNQDTWLDLSDKYFVLLGAGSAMGPYPILMSLGANVIAIDLDRKSVWKKLVDVAKNSSGTLTFPLKVQQKGLSDEQILENAGANLFTQTPEIRNWLLDVLPGKELVVGSYAYLDGERHVKVSLAMDAIVRDLTLKRKAACAYLCTPTDDHAISVGAVKAQIQIYENVGFPVSIIKAFLPLNVKPAVKPTKADANPIPYIDAIVPEQGPNYALAKRIQHWRAIVSRFSTGVVVSSNIAPASATVSVTSNWSFKLAYEGFSFFKPLEVFDPRTSNAVMTALLIHDLRNEKSVANPKTELANPLLLFTEGAIHGGIWRMPFKFSAIGFPAAIFALLSGWVGGMALIVVVLGMVYML
ncbi:Very-long-chain (3R)-3-hydroxyacyl-CoA dehydratase PASTICCINO 2 [Nowakowskiella sp. JEL0407]|nr:Very-long-chain (3R)-3-hydroxyacyl-CoA dehydratase PASTICCINO 2 [Nowakowskiella sp. JEL0407]